MIAMNTTNLEKCEPWYHEHFLNAPDSADLSRCQALQRRVAELNRCPQGRHARPWRRILSLAKQTLAAAVRAHGDEPSGLPAQGRTAARRVSGGTISELHKCIFIHIPKTAGRTIAAALGVPWSGAAHRTYRSFRRDPRYQDYAVFTVVRNPYDRFVSIYHHVMKAKVHAEQAIRGPGGRCLPFASWLAYNYSYYKGSFSGDCNFGGYSQAAGAPFWFAPQKCWLVDEAGEINIDRIVRFESLSKELPDLLSRLGLLCDSIPWENKGERTSVDFHDYYDEYTKSLVAELAADDMQAFNYSF